MANSRSNIYPVQLQGAELNLNKYDAEIKQYSGFNKNNAPFVGGCLSNIFTKDETIEGATSKNTYIAPNGDVYRVTTEGLFKNDELLIDTSDADFFDVVDLGADAFPESTVYVYDEETYIYIKDGKFYYHSKEIDYNISSDFSAININIFPEIKYQIQKKDIGGGEHCEIVGIQFDKGSNAVLWVDVFVVNASSEFYTVGYEVGASYFSSHSTELSFVMKIIEKPYYEDRFYIVTLSAPYFISNVSNSKNNFCFEFIGSGLTFSPMNVLPSGTNINNCTDYRFTDKYAVRCNVQGNSISYHSAFRSTYTINANTKRILLNDLDSSREDHLVGSNRKSNIVKSWGILTALKIENGKCFTIDDDITNFAYVDENAAITDYKVQFNLGGILNGCVLINNRLASGLSLPGGMQLVSEWNTVDLDHIFFGDNTDDWRENKYVYIWKNTVTDKWYKLIKSAPWLKVIGNQVIINANSISNAVRITDNKKLLFAPAWNNRRPYYSYENTSSEAYYVATAINEYNLEDNASIIINPVLVNGSLPNNITIDRYPKDIGNYLLVNLYQNTTPNSAEILYKISQDLITKNFVAIDDKKNLPFPSNTDGNIQYSPSLFAVQKGQYGNLVFISEGGTAYKLMTYDNKAVMSYFLSTAIEGLQDFFTIQGQLYGILDNQIYNFSIINEVANRGDFIVSVEGLQFVGNTPYEALFFSKTNRCLYSFTGANVLNAKQFVDKISEVIAYKYNPATQSIFLITDIGVIVYSLFGIYQIEFANCKDVYLLNNGVILTDDNGTFRYVKYYKEETTEDYTKENVQLETCFYGMNNQTVTINDCLYLRLFSEEHEEGEIKVSASTISLKGRKTEETKFKFKASDWDKMTHTIYLRYQPKEQRGLGISFSIDSPFKIASMSIGSQADAILIDKVSKGAINAPAVTSNNNEW